MCKIYIVQVRGAQSSILFGIFLLFLCSETIKCSQLNKNRPILISKAFESNGDVYYFGVGSNLLQEKVVNRGLNGTKIHVQTFLPAKVKNHRLAFNMRGFPPLEPAMGGIEPCEGSTCHGALMKMTISEYEKLWMSEGGGFERPSYEELTIFALPYESDTPVQAIALRASQHVRLPCDASPSARYMNLIIRGARQLGLEASYINYLEAIPVCDTFVPSILRLLALKHYFFTGFLFRLKLRPIIKMISSLLWLCYYSNSGQISLWPLFRQKLSHFTTGLVLLPGALLGYLLEVIYRARGHSPPAPFGSPVKNESSTSENSSKPIS